MIMWVVTGISCYSVSWRLDWTTAHRFAGLALWCTYLRCAYVRSRIWRRLDVATRVSGFARYDSREQHNSQGKKSQTYHKDCL